MLKPGTEAPSSGKNYQATFALVSTGASKQEDHGFKSTIWSLHVLTVSALRGFSPGTLVPPTVQLVGLAIWRF